jgi:hypothetical protein
MVFFDKLVAVSGRHHKRRKTLHLCVLSVLGRQVNCLDSQKLYIFVYLTRVGTNMLRRKSLFELIIVLALIFLPFVTLTPQLFKGQRNVNRPEDFFEMSLEELMTVEVAMADEPDVNRANFFEMPLEELMTIEVS